MPGQPTAPAAPRPRRRALCTLALAAPLLLAASQLRLQPHDQGLLIDVAGTPVDATGRWRAAWQRLSRDCGTVQRLAPDAPDARAALQALQVHSPPASTGARPLQWLRQGDWLLTEVMWDGPGLPPGPALLDPAIVPLHHDGRRWQVMSAGVWSGDTGPWVAPVFIRGWLQRQLPAMPGALALCLDPQWPAFAR